MVDFSSSYRHSILVNDFFFFNFFIWLRYTNDAFRNNALLDCLYGIIVLLISLLGFISLVWLKDQLNNGLGHNWVEENIPEVNHAVVRDHDRHHQLEQYDMLTNEKPHVLNRVVVAPYAIKLHKCFNIQSIKLSDDFLIRFRMFIADLRIQELKFSLLLNKSLLSSSYFLQNAAKKHYGNYDNVSYFALLFFLYIPFCRSSVL